MAHSLTSHVVVAGAGIVGSSIAFNLAQRGAQVTLLDSSDPGQGASAVSFAWINARDKSPRQYHDLNRRSLDIWDRFSRRLGGDVGLTWGGELRWATTLEEGEALVGRIRELQSWGYPIFQITSEEMARLEPGLSIGAVTAASFTEIDGHVDTARVVKACIDGATRLGATVLANTPLTGLRLHNSKIEAVLTGTDEIPCGILLLAGGPDTTVLADFAEIKLPLHHTFGATLFTEPISRVFQNVAVVHTPRDCPPCTNFRQLPDGSVQVHGSPGDVKQDGSSGRTDEEINSIFEAARRFLPALKDTRIREIRRGRRPIPEDGLPIIGYTEKVPNLYVATMHSGVTLAALVGEFAAIEILEQKEVDVLKPYRLERFHQ